MGSGGLAVRIWAGLSSCSFATLVLLTGCNLQSTAPSAPEAGARIEGSVHGGQQPVNGAHVYLFAAGTSGYGGASTSLITSGSSGSDALGEYVLTASDGTFSISGDYSCTSGTQVYLLAAQGNPGLSGNQINANLALMAALGQCPSAGNFAGTVPFISVNEVTTVASVYAISGFMTDLTHVSSSGTALAQTGIANAFAAVPNLVNIGTGAALATTPVGNGTVPQGEINTLANIIASCVNTAGACSSACTTLFADATNGGTQPTDTVTAALNIAHNPGTNIAALFGLQASSAPFAPALSAVPNDFTIALMFTGGGIYSPGTIAIDAAGNVWATGVNNVNELSPIGTPISPSSGYTAGVGSDPGGIAADASGYIWVVNSNSVSKLIAATGAPVVGSPYSGGGLNNPNSIAIDAQGNLWITNSSSNVTELNGATGAPLSITGYADPNDEFDIAIDASGTVLASGGVLSSHTGVLTVSPAAYSGSVYVVGGDGPIAFDSAGNAWIGGSGGVTLTSAWSAAAGSPFSGGGECGYCTNSVAIDGAGNVWLSDGEFEPPDRVGLSELSNSGAPVSPSTGYQTSYLGYPLQIAIDGSGNVWVADGGVGSVDLIEFVGAAVPVVTPLAAGVVNNTLGTRP